MAGREAWKLNQACCVFLYESQLWMVFIFLSTRDKSKEEEYFIIYEITWNSDFGVKKLSFLGTQLCPFIYALSPLVFVLKWLGKSATTEADGPQSIKYPLLTLYRKVCQFLEYRKKKKYPKFHFLKEIFFRCFPALFLLVKEALHYFVFS